MVNGGEICSKCNFFLDNGRQSDKYTIQVIDKVREGVSTLLKLLLYVLIPLGYLIYVTYAEKAGFILNFQLVN